MLRIKTRNRIINISLEEVVFVEECAMRTEFMQCNCIWDLIIKDKK